MTIKATIVAVFLCLFQTVVMAFPNAPITQMYSHAHHDDSWMVSFQTMYSSADEIRHGSSSLSKDTVLEHFHHAPVSMQMSMSMLDVMKAVNENWTIMAMVPYLSHQMKMEMADNQTHSHSTSGVGDISVSTLYTAYRDDNKEFFWITGVSLPSGSIDEKDDDGNRLSYPMQLGSGTWDVLTGFTLNQEFGDINVGWHTLGTFRTGESKNGYRLGHKFETSVWLGYAFNETLKGTGKLAITNIGSIHGEDETLSPVHSGINSDHMHADALNTTQVGGTQVDASLGLTKQFGMFNIGVEAGAPIVKRYSGYVMSQAWWTSLGVQIVF